MKRICKKYLTVFCALSAFFCVHGEKIYADAENVTGVMDSAGDMVAVWTDFDPDTDTAIVVVATLPVSGSWSAPTTISNNENEATTPAVAINAAGNVIVGWQEENAITTTMNAATFSFGGGGWSSAQQLSANTENVGETLAVTVSNAATVTVGAVWTAVLGSNDYYSARAATATFGGTWSTPVTISSE